MDWQDLQTSLPRAPASHTSVFHQDDTGITHRTEDHLANPSITNSLANSIMTTSSRD